jgi:hypothetical protein
MKEMKEMNEVELLRRRDFLKSLRKWSGAVIGGVVLGGVLAPREARADWINRRGGAGGGGWVNGGGGGGGTWVNRR